MSNRVFLNSKENPIFIEKQPFASGGEGNIYRIITARYRDSVVKIYHSDKRTKAKEGKVKYLVQNPPDAQNVNGHNSVVWATGIIYDEKGFAGLMMPFAEGDKLVILTSSKIPKRFRAKWNRFSLKNQSSSKLRMAICFNIAAAVYQIHNTKKYVLVDLKPDNIIIQPNGLVAIVDVDSMEVIENGKVLFPALVTTPEFAPPEFHKGIKPGKKSIYTWWDNYAMAIIFYKLLFGVHPFAGSAKPPYDKLNTLEEKIEHGLFVHSPSKQRFINVLPPPHKRFVQLLPAIRELFVACFEEGHDFQKRRPTASDWCSVISGKPLVNLKRKLPSSVLKMERVELSKPKPLPIASNQLINTGVIPKVEKKDLVTFEDNVTFERILLGIVAFVTYAVIQGSFMIAMLAGMGFLAIRYSTRSEVKEKKKLSNGKRIKSEILKQENFVKQLKSKLSSYNKLYDKELNKITSDQYKILQDERQSIDELQMVFSKLLSEKDQILIDLEEEEKKELELLASKYPAAAIKPTTQKDTSTNKELEQQIRATQRELAEVLVLKNNPNSQDFSSKQFLLPIGHKLDVLRKEKERALKNLDLEFDGLIAKENKRLTTEFLPSKAFRDEIYNKIANIRNEKIARNWDLDDEFKAKEKVIHDNKRLTLATEYQKLNAKLSKLEAVLVSRDASKDRLENDLTEFNIAKKLIEEKYNKDYQLILNEGKKSQKGIGKAIREVKAETSKKTNIVFSKNIIPFDASSKFNEYEQEAKLLLQLKEENAKTEVELKSYQDITFWKYMEMVLTFS